MMNSRYVLLILSLFCASTGAMAETRACPDLSTTVQVGACPSEEDLEYTFKGYCSDNARMYDKTEQVCTDYKLYRALKNVSLWETRDGSFDGYVSCDPAKAGFAAGKAKAVDISRQGSVTRVTCSYTTGVVFTHRTKAKCVADAAACESDPAACKASCE